MNEKLYAKKKYLESALMRLEEALKEEKTDITRDSAILRFQLALELSWKYLRALLEEQAISTYSPKNVIREAAQAGLLDDPETWIKFINYRNDVVHLYKEDLAEELYKSIRDFPNLVSKILSEGV